ncbi:Cys-tRNA(Pro) deacylase [Salinicola aestuarinus]|uniref:Cys-tRNA(Pro) deacylase n=1 Tax=Salinicola aestuarinus TaxID=1949082 RepID=UPI000DA23C00|nr:Cys-tRNA(Pro) deacylase [Salinicola aestuarinus]
MTPAIRLLESRGIVHEVTSYTADDGSSGYGQAAVAALSLPAESVFKTLMAKLDDGRLVVALVPVSGSLDLKVLAKAAGARKAHMAAAPEAERATGYAVGGISPIGQKKRLSVYIDQSALDLPRIHVSGGRRGLELSLAPADLVSLTGARPTALAKE